jgi:hypothetical protein
MNEQEAEWSAEFERFGEEQIRSSLTSGMFPEPKRQFAFRWLGYGHHHPDFQKSSAEV